MNGNTIITEKDIMSQDIKEKKARYIGHTKPFFGKTGHLNYKFGLVDVEMSLMIQS